MSCNRLSPDLQDELNMQVMELSTFLNDNYAVGDSVYFRNWHMDWKLKQTVPGEIRGFVVTENYIKKFSRTIVGTDDADGLFSHQEGYKQIVVLKGSEDELFIEVMCAIEDKRYVFSGGSFLINDMKEEDGYCFISKKPEEVKKIQGEYAWCEMQKNVGVTRWWNFDYDSIYSNIPTFEWRLLN